MKRTVDAITFDYWNTLVHDDPGDRDARLDAWMGLLEGEGVAVERDHLGLALDGAWKRFLEAWRDDRQYTHVDAAADAVDALADLGHPVPADLRERLVGVVVDGFARSSDRTTFRLTEGIEECLVALKSAGLRIGIVCDVGLTPSPVLRRFLDEQGLLGLFDHWSFSDEVGAYKPSPRIFEHALAGLGDVEPGRAAHIGDLRRTDVAGALGMGMLALRYTGVFDDDAEGPEAHHVVSSHADLPALLGV